MQTRTLGCCLFPNLHSIHWDTQSWESLPFLRFLFNPELVDVCIEFPSNGSHIYSPATISMIPTGALTHLVLKSMRSDPLSMDALCNLLDEASETLKVVHLDADLSVAVVEKLIQLPNLRQLRARCAGKMPNITCIVCCV